MGVWGVGFVVFGWDGVDFTVWDATTAEDTESASIVFLYLILLSLFWNMECMIKAAILETMPHFFFIHTSKEFMI